ncbi:hypothetical protein TUM12370_07720 [Salmonella enterica subsp. enterica serovar Choleraesuis]|nr:hypothetical protein TUM12370_07720 [Salmonella enterica subsp. enterica serovar Choleraesuis]
MFYIQQEEDGNLIRIERQPFDSMTGTRPEDDAQVLALQALQEARVASLQRLQNSDLEMVRVLEDLIAVLMTKGIISITDLPVAAQTKLLNRAQARQALGGLERLMDEDEDAIL